MSPEIVSEGKPSLLERLNLITLLVGLLVAAGGVFGSFAVTSYRVGTIESTVKEHQEKMLTKDEFKAYLDGLKSDITEIKSDVREIRNEAREKKR